MRIGVPEDGKARYMELDSLGAAARADACTALEVPVPTIAWISSHDSSQSTHEISKQQGLSRRPTRQADSVDSNDGTDTTHLAGGSHVRRIQSAEKSVK